MCCSRYFDFLKNEKSVDFFFKVLIFSLTRFARSKLWKLVNFRTFCAKKLFKDFICFICRIGEVHFSELVKGICHLSAARRQIGRKYAVFWSGKNWIWSGKSQWKVREFCFFTRVAILSKNPINSLQFLVGCTVKSYKFLVDFTAKLKFLVGCTVKSYKFSIVLSRLYCKIKVLGRLYCKIL